MALLGRVPAPPWPSTPSQRDYNPSGSGDGLDSFPNLGSLGVRVRTNAFLLSCLRLPNREGLRGM